MLANSFFFKSYNSANILFRSSAIPLCNVPWQLGHKLTRFSGVSRFTFICHSRIKVVMIMELGDVLQHTFVLCD